VSGEPDATWNAGARAHAARLIAGIRLTAARAALGSKDGTAAANLASVVLETDPYDEAAVRILMEAHTVAGRSALAVAAYGQLRERLRADLGVEPSPETEATYAGILQIPGRRHTGSLAEPPQPPPRASLPGRDRELKALDDAFERVAAEGAELILEAPSRNSPCLPKKRKRERSWAASPLFSSRPCRRR
jgi:transcriptional activator